MKNNDTTIALLAILGIILLAPLMVLYSSFSWGYVAAIISDWFILPLYPKFPLLTWLQYAGIMFFINCFIHVRSTDIKSEYKEKNSWFGFIIAPWGLLFGAWILHLFY